MKQFLSTACLAGALVYGQSGVAPPQVGIIQDANHSLRPVLGLAANFVLGDSLGEGVVSSASSGSFGLVKTDTSILVLDRAGQLLFTMDADAGPALFAFSSEGVPAFVYLPQSQLLLKWVTDHLEPTPFSADQIGGAVLAIASAGPDRLSLIAKRDDGTWFIDLPTSSQYLIPAVDGPVLLRGDGSLLYATADSFVLHHPPSPDLAIDATGLQPASLIFEQMGKDWVHVTDQNSTHHFALRLTPGSEQVYQLPESQQ
jgi:hypothetical protein